MAAVFDYDFLIIGSGFGGSVSALRLAEKGYRVGVVEMGRRWTPQNLPKTNWDLRNYLWRPALGLRGFYSMRLFRHVQILHGNAVGGGSITYACTLLVPPDSVWRDGGWQGLDDWERVMPQHYATAQRMLGVTRNPYFGAADHLLKSMADTAGVGSTFYPTQVGIFFGTPGEKPGTRHEDPYFDGAGPTRNSCIYCGGCMVGCRHNAKNTLDKNYLYLAEKRGAKVLEETRVIHVRPLDGHADGSAGYEVIVRPTFDSGAPTRRLTAQSVVFAASSLGTQELLFKLKQEGSLPNLSDQIGKRVRTNAESIIAVRYPDGKANLSDGIAIGSGIYIDAHTHIEAVRFPNGSDSLAGMTTVLTGGTPGWTRPLSWLLTLLHLLLTRPLATLRALFPVGFARQTIIFLVMQTIDGHIDLRYERPWFWPFRKMLRSHGKRIPTYIPAANQFAKLGAKATGGVALSMIAEILFDIPTTAHCMGGAAMADAPERGVIDAQNRVFNYRNLYVVDGSMLAANLGVNPSLTITALAERAMSFIPPAPAPAPAPAEAGAVELATAR